MKILACSKCSDSGERCDVKKSERLEQAMKIFAHIPYNINR